MIRHIILAAGLLVLPLQARADWLDDIAVKYGCAPRPPGAPTIWYCDGRDHSPAGLAAEDRRTAEAAHRTQIAADPHGVDAVMKRLRREAQ